ncbi:MAG TPA: hypothetical protein VNJ01_12060 [Bacteriovoracaceae bacterium]|nr:hypothetical protein [Bacteriovoracaceae bacterium]
MRNFFIAFGTAVCVLLAYSNYHGMTMEDMTKAKWSPKGKQAYHK